MSMDLKHDLKRQRKESCTYLKTSEKVAIQNHRKMQKTIK